MKKTLLILSALVLSLSLFSCDHEQVTTVPKYICPFVENMADPVCYKHTDGYYYFIASDGSPYDEIYMMKSKTINGFRNMSKTKIGTYGQGWLADVDNYLWAPDITYINGSWYMFLTANAKGTGPWSVRSYVARCSDADPLTGQWELLGRVQAVTGDTFDPAKDINIVFNLDAAVLQHGKDENGYDQWYYAWAMYIYDGDCKNYENGRVWKDGKRFDHDDIPGQITVYDKEYYALPGKDAWSSIFIGKVVNDEYGQPDFTKIVNAHVISIPEYPWEMGQDRTMFTYNGGVHSDADVMVDEGPAFLKRNGKIFLVFSAAACDESYCLGLLTADENSDLCDPNSWKKTPDPVFKTSEKNNAWGPGHCQFTRSEDDEWDVIVYHRRRKPGLDGGTGLSDQTRSACAKVFTWNKDGSPNFGEAE